jgi:hypothetical protein
LTAGIRKQKVVGFKGRKVKRGNGARKRVRKEEIFVCMPLVCIVSSNISSHSIPSCFLSGEVQLFGHPVLGIRRKYMFAYCMDLFVLVIGRSLHFIVNEEYIIGSFMYVCPSVAYLIILFHWL